MSFNPPQYEWEATTVREAFQYLEAVQQLSEAHITSLDQSNLLDRRDTERRTPLAFKLTLDLTPLVERINDKRTVDTLAEGFEG